MTQRSKHRRHLRRFLDQWFATIVRYLGVITFCYAAFIDRGKNPALVPAATGMILFKTIVGSGDKD